MSNYRCACPLPPLPVSPSSTPLISTSGREGGSAFMWEAEESQSFSPSSGRKSCLYKFARYFRESDEKHMITAAPGYLDASLQAKQEHPILL